MSDTCQSLSDRDIQLLEKEKIIGDHERELHAVRDELTQKDYALRKAQIDLQVCLCVCVCMCIVMVSYPNTDSIDFVFNCKS